MKNTFDKVTQQKNKNKVKPSYRGGESSRGSRGGHGGGCGGHHNNFFQQNRTTTSNNGDFEKPKGKNKDQFKVQCYMCDKFGHSPSQSME